GLEHPPRVCVTEVPLLYEVGSESQFDKVVVVTAPSKLRRARSAVASDDRQGRLLDDREKAARADYVYANTGTLEELDEFVASVLHDLVSCAARSSPSSSSSSRPADSSPTSSS